MSLLKVMKIGLRIRQFSALSNQVVPSCLNLHLEDLLLRLHFTHLLFEALNSERQTAYSIRFDLKKLGLLSGIPFELSAI